MAEEIKVKTLAERWQGFEKLVLQGTNPIQVSEMQKAFYAGASALMGLVMFAVANIEEQEKIEEVLNRTTKEIDDFFDLLMSTVLEEKEK